MSRIKPARRAARNGAGRPIGLLAAQSARALAARTSRPGSPGLIARGPGFTIPRLRVEHYEFSQRACSANAAQFAANLIRAGVADPLDWAATRSIAPFLQRTLQRFVGERASAIDRAFSIYLTLSPTGDCYGHETETDPRRVLIAFRVVDHVAWVNLTPALELLQKEHELLPSFLYHSLNKAVSRWFRVFDIEDARWRWDDWIAMRKDEEKERQAECERNGEAYEPTVQLDEPRLPACVQKEMPILSGPAVSLARSRKTKRLIAAVEELAQIAQRPHPPITHPFSEEDREDLFPDSDQDVPMLTLAFGEHDVVTEFLNDEIEMAGQVTLEPWPIFKMDGTDPASIRTAFACGNLALDTLAAASRVLTLIPGFEPMS